MNAIHDPWLPVRLLDGTTREVGLLEALQGAHQIESLVDQRPLGPPTQLRLLVALIQRIFQPEDAGDWRRLWRVGSFDSAPLDDYFQTWEQRFELLDAKTPFLQVGGDFHISRTNPVDKLAHDLDPAGYNDLFSHADGDPIPATQPEALRRLIMAQSCALGGGKSSDPTWRDKTIRRPNFAHASVATSAIVTLEGANLFQTVLLNLVPNVVSGDEPVWERDLTPAYFDQTTANGPLDRLTNLSRMIRLLPNANGDIAACYYTQGRTLNEPGADTMVSYRKDKVMGLVSRKIGIDRAAWRDLHALLEFSRAEGDADLRAAVLRFVGGRIDEGDVMGSAHVRMRLFGVVADKAKVLLWRGDRISLPIQLLARAELVAVLGARMAEASDTAIEIGRRTRSMCWHYLAPVHDQMKPDTANVNHLADQLDTRQTYWAQLESRFPQLLDDIALLPNTEPDTVTPLTSTWRACCADAARVALLTAQDRLGESPRSWRAVAAVSTYFNSWEDTHGR